MTHTNPIFIVLLCSLLAVFHTGLIPLASAGQNTADEKKIAPDLIHGKITKVINAANYTYTEIESDNKKFWAAGPVTPLTIGDMVSFSTGMPMENFHSKSINKDFSVLYFVARFITDKDNATITTPSAISPHAQISKKQAHDKIPNIDKLDNGATISEIYNQKTLLKGKTIRLRGQVTKFTPHVMGKNWLHIRDSSSQDDLTVTTNNISAIGDIVIIEGKLNLDKDYNYGYVYPVIIEDAKLIKE